MNDRLINSQELAVYLRMNPASLRAWARDGHGPPSRLMGREYRWRESEVRAWLESLPAGQMSGRRVEMRSH